MICLTVTDSQGNCTQYPITEEENYHLTIGRSTECDIALPQDNHLSRLHCRVSYMQGMLILRDCGSSNGTYLNGKRIEKDVMLPGRVYTIGQTSITCTDCAAAWQQPAPEPAAVEQPSEAPEPAPLPPKKQAPKAKPAPRPQPAPAAVPQPAPVAQPAPAEEALPEPPPEPQPVPAEDPLPVPIVLPYGMAPPGWQPAAPPAAPAPAAKPQSPSTPRRRTTRRAADTTPPAKKVTLKKDGKKPRTIKHAEAKEPRKTKSSAPHADPNARRSVRATQQAASERPVSIQQKQEGISGSSIGLPEDFPLSFRLSKSSNRGLSPETRLQFALRAGADCYTYLIQYDSCGGVEIIYPRSKGRSKPVYAGLEVLYPPSGRAAYDFVVEEPLGNDAIIALACTEDVDLEPLHAQALERLGENPEPGQAEIRAIKLAAKQVKKALRWSSSVLYLRTENE